MRQIIKVLAILLLLAPSVLSAKKTETRIDVIPYPMSLQVDKGTFTAAGAMFSCDPSIDSKSQKMLKEFAARISFITGKTSSFASPVGMAKAAENIGKKDKFLIFKYDVSKLKGFVFLKDEDMEPEEYAIHVTKKNCVVSAKEFNGFFYAVQTLKQLMPESIYVERPMPSEKFRIPCCTILDKPRFGYRGMHLDCSRHFFSVAEVKKYLDIMSIYKLNRFHWHLTDDQGWRIEIKKYPKLTEVGAYRKGTAVKKDFSTHDGVRYGGYYTQDQVKEIVSYAAGLGITVIPEIDLPGHMLGALTAYPELGCTGGPYEVWTRWGISDQVLCPGKEITFTFLEDVLSEVMDLFPSEYIHIGGDECPKTEWDKCPACQAKIKELGIKGDEKHTSGQYLQNYVTSRVQKFVNDRGRRIIGWDEILEGDLAEGATVMSWRGVAGGVKASAMGFDVIMTPNTYLYLDYYQSKDASEPFGIGGHLPLEKVYGYEPFEGLDTNQQKHILGVQANLWTEYIATPEHLEYMLLPRMVALSEIQWCPAEAKNYERFTSSLKSKSFAIFDLLGYNYRKF